MMIPPKKLAHFHMFATLVWLALVIPSVVFWKDSIAWVVLMSVWANFASHFSAWQAARGEVKQDEQHEEHSE